MKIVDTFFHNPQYRVVLEEVDEGDEEDKCTVIIALMQKNRRQMRRSGGIDLLTIGFAIYHVSQLLLLNPLHYIQFQTKKQD
jgi:calpain